MISRICASIVMSLAISGNSDAFSPNSIKPLAKVTTKLHSHAIDSDSDAMYMMMKAEACAHSETCSIEDAERYLQEILHLQSDCCVSGKLASHEVCQDVQYPAEIVATLRSKIAQKQKQSTSLFLNPVYASLAAAYLIAGAYSISHSPGIDAFTAEEWWWSIRDGYVLDLISSFMKYGGLPAIDPTVSVVDITPFTLQEWWWSLRDGYFGDILAQSFKNGGMISASLDSSIEDGVALAFLPEEW
eukprot:CAMPEP_0176497868 /NCGR_PEP_ID=MMETSP0200_2-20121128/11982_1 /TAXON_ID=947934 /ORGANISM="Chaetoceros sp., Strain GSL56" /LENGTH=243 /DNA_ID=CAMNT_0017895967 /DNA_START=105 /DNA_END=833 /DNA_ORIENTATION=+